LRARHSADDYAPFGIGTHRCIADALVMRLGTVFVEELSASFDWSIQSDGPVHLGRFHWEPAPSFAVELESRKR
jgi:cytochrome P450